MRRTVTGCADRSLRPARSRRLLVVAPSTVVVHWLAAAHGGPARGRHRDRRRVGTTTNATPTSARGGLLLPASVEHGDRASRWPRCLGCRWRLTTPCAGPGPGNAFDGEPTCLSVVRGCPAGGRLLRTWFQAEGQAWREIGLVCIRPVGPRDRVRGGRTVARASSEGIPRARSRGSSPRKESVTQIPVVFDSGQQAGSALGSRIARPARSTCRATPAWSWQFGDGPRRTRRPGRALSAGRGGARLPGPAGLPGGLHGDLVGDLRRGRARTVPGARAREPERRSDGSRWGRGGPCSATRDGPSG